MESDKPIFPEFELFNVHPIERIRKIGRFIFGVRDVPLRESNHYISEHFQPELPFEPSDGEALPSVQDLIDQAKEARG